MSPTATRLTADVTATLQPGFSGTEVPDWVVRAGAEGLVSLCLYGDNVTAGSGLADLTARLHRALPGVLLAADEEGGDVTRLDYPGGSTAPGNAVLGRLDDLPTTRAVARALGARLAGLGIGLDLAPSVDVNSSPDNPVIGVRSFGADPALVGRHAAAFVEGLQSTGVAACAKHFPGHGDTSVDSHLALPRVDVPLEVLRERELEPFRAAVAAGVRAVMTSHIVVPALDPDRPATFSPAAVRVLREDLGFTGVLVSDALDMAGASAQTGVGEAAVRALAAGVDLLCLGPRLAGEDLLSVRSAVLDAVSAGRLTPERVAEAADRVRALAADAGKPPQGEVAPGGDLVPADVVARAFHLTPNARRWLARPGPVAIVQVASGANLAVGDVVWGPAAIEEAVDETDVPEHARVAVVGRGLGPGHPGHEAAARLRGTGHDVVLVECGWPRGGADIETYGGSPAAARALVAVLRGGLHP